MNQRELKRLDRDLTEYLDTMMEGMGRVERVAAMRSYVTGLLLDGERKSIEPMAARLVESPTEIQAMRQRLQQAVTIATWSDAAMFERIAKTIEDELPSVEAMVLDDTGFAKSGKHSVGVARQYSGTLGRVDNCQVAVSLHLAGEASSACIAFELYLPEEWCSDRDRREKAGVPEEIEFQTKHQIALKQIDRALALGVRKHVVLGDAGYGDSTGFREQLTARGLLYVVARATSTPTILLSASRTWRRACRIERSPGAKGRGGGSHLDLLQYGSERLIGTRPARRPGTSNGSSPNGRKASRRLAGSGCPHCPRRPR